MTNRRPTILVVDDNAATRYSTARVLRAAGFLTLEAASGAEAIAQAVHRPDLVILDVNLPDMNGYEVCRQLRLIGETARTPVIHLSASFISDVDKVQGYESGADGYVTHPVEPPVLIATVNAFLRARAAEDALRASEEKFKAVFDQAVSGIALLDQDMTFKEANLALAQMLGVQAGDLVGQGMADFLASGHRDTLQGMDAELRTTRVWRGSVPMIRADGPEVDLEWTVSTMSVPGTRLAIATDVTERNRTAAQVRDLLASERVARSEAERANRLKDDFLAALSHELRSPLNVIVGWSQMLRRRPEGADPDLRRGLDAIERNAKVQTQLIGDLLDVARITSGKLRFDAQVFDIRALVNAALENARTMAAARGIELVVDVERAPQTLVWDQARFQQVVWNLTDNAVKFSQPGGRVDVVVEASPTGATLTVRDAGRGISREFLPFVFDRFRQEDSGSRRWHGGLGLGLAIVKHVVELQGGSVAVDSEGEGLGATFSITFVNVGDPAKLGKSAPIRGASRNTSVDGVRVLVVEDDDDARAFVTRLLTDARADVCEVSNAHEAMAALDGFAAQVIVSDIGMPGVDGYDLMRSIRKHAGPAQNAPAVALTAFVRDDDRRRAIEAGYNAHLAKPVDAARLLEMVHTLAASQSPKA